MASEFGEVPFSLVEIVVADYNSGAYATPVSIDKDQKITIEPQADTDELRDSGSIVELLTVATHATLTLGYGGIDHSAFAVLTGTSTSTSGTTPNQVRTHDFYAGAANALPYFGFIGVGRAVNGSYVAVGCPKAILDMYPSFMLDGTSNKFVVNETSGRAAADDSLNNLCFRVRSYESLADYTTPASAAAFLAFFNANPAP